MGPSDPRRVFVEGSRVRVDGAMTFKQGTRTFPGVRARTPRMVLERCEE